MSAATREVVVLGETMALLTTPPSGRLALGGAVTTSIGGAESNVAIGLVRLGIPAAWVSRVGDDAWGRMVVRELRAEGVEVVATVDPVAPTGLMLKQLRHGVPRRVVYHRTGSAASHLGPTDVDAVTDRISDAGVLHVSGITPALGRGPAAAVLRAVEVARAAGTLVSFDVNHRSALWSVEQAAPVLSEVAARSNVVFAGPEEAALLLGAPVPTDPEGALACARRLCERGTEVVVVKLGAFGSVAVDTHGDWVAPTTPVHVVDAVGAGDAFVAGFLAALIAGDCVQGCLAQGNLAGGAVCRVPGDWEGLPTTEELVELAGLAGVSAAEADVNTVEVVR